MNDLRLELRGQVPPRRSLSRRVHLASNQCLLAASASTLLAALALHPLAAQAQSANEYVAPAAEEIAPAAEEIAPPAPSDGAVEAVGPAPAAEAVMAPEQNLGAMQVTGSAIARTDAETAVPVTILRIEQLRDRGITSTEQLMSRLSSNASSYGAGISTGTTVIGGASFADLRGIGPNKTLVLLNGRRIANNAMNGGAVDLNMIPFEALERVEILRDGASALYGTDAIGGVINFITKRNLQGGNLETQLSTPTASGGGQKREVAGSWGTGDLEEDGFNLMGVLSHSDDNAVSSDSRDFVRNDDPRGVFTGSSFNSPTNYIQGNNFTSAGGANCVGANQLQRGGDCYYDYSRGVQVVNPTEQTSLYTRGAFKLGENHTGALSYFWTHNNIDTVGAPAPLSTVPQIQPGTPFFPGNGIVDAPSGWQINPNQPVGVYYRGVGAGNRLTRNTNDAKRAMFDLDGRLGAWNYNSAVYYNQSRLDMAFRGGYLNDALVERAMNDGRLNPFSPTLSEAGRQALRDAAVNGTVQSSKGEVYTWDGNASREIGDWFGAGPAAIAVGGEARHERFESQINAIADLASSSGLSSDSSTAASRDVQGAYTELNVPLLESLEVTGAVRYDKYSSIGDTTNPKVSFRYQPIQPLVVRGSYSEGFRAPTLYEMYNPQYLTFSPGGQNDPTLCPGGNVAPGGVTSRDCNTQFRNQLGGNPDLEPETAKNWTMGFVFEPLEGLSGSLDFWWIELQNTVGVRSVDSVLRDNPDSVVRNPQTGAIDYVPTLNENLGKTRTNGLDLALDYQLPTASGLWGVNLSGTYVDRYETRIEGEENWDSSLGQYDRDGNVIFRWKHNLTLSWTKGPWNAATTAHYQSGYKDYDPELNQRVSSYTTWDALVGYRFSAGPALTLGVLNVFDQDPSFSNQPQYGQAGYDARFSDGLGRVVYGRLNYSF